MAIYIGNTEFDETKVLQVGTDTVAEVYVGTFRVWPPAAAVVGGPRVLENKVDKRLLENEVDIRVTEDAG